MKSQDNNGCFKKVQGEKYKVKGTRLKNKIALYFLPFTFYLLPFTCRSQDAPVSLTYEAISIGYGTGSVYDSYLSPLKYSGNNVGLLYEKMKNTGLMNGNLAAQHLFNVNYSWTENNPGTASYYSGFIDYNYGLLYRMKPVDNLQVFVGMQAGGMIGFIYNTRNGNNPATGKARLDLSLSAMANYKWHIRSQPLYFRDQISVPFIGAMYSPQYGTSYYEIGLGDTKNLIHLASFNNHFAIRNMLSAEIPLNCFTLRLSYLFSFYETSINDLNTRWITNTFYIGFSTNFFVVSGKQKKNNYRYVFE